jgi:hypothetical protein
MSTPIPTSSITSSPPVVNKICEKSQNTKKLATSPPEEIKSKCKEIAEIYNKTKVELAKEETNRDLANSFSVNGFVNNVGRAASASNKVSKDSINIINKVFDSKNITEIENKCKNVSENIQINSIKISEQCKKSALEICKDFSTSNDKLACIREINAGLVVSNITQENVNTSEQKCVINNLIQQLTAQSDDSAIQAVAKIMQEASGPMTHNKSESLDCNEVNTKLNSENYSSSISCCLNGIASKQLNEIDSCGIITDVSQKNINKQIQDCFIGTTTKQEQEQKSKTMIDTLLELTQKATMPGSASCASCVFFLMLIGIGIAISFILSKSNKPKIDDIADNVYDNVSEL